MTDYIALAGKKADDLEEKTGYYGERIALKVQELGLNTCWVAMIHGKRAAAIGKGEKQIRAMRGVLWQPFLSADDLHFSFGKCLRYRA